MRTPRPDHATAPADRGGHVRILPSQDTPELGGMPAPAPSPAAVQRWATEPADLKRYRVITTHGSLNVHATCQADAIRKADESRLTEPGEMALGAYLRPDRRPR